nr:leucine-rich repeat-containing protein 51 isoform X1 [Ciona intestinalis]|eukprot:XP_002120556.1 leucine-rich repeat-containing protein 51 isoform X1 [Ciona intestinalis]
MEVAVPTKQFDHYEVESIASKRYSVGEILARMKPEEDNFKENGPPADFSFRDARKMSDFPRTTPREGPHAYVTVDVFLPPESTAPSVTPSADRKDPENQEEGAQKQPVKYCSRAIRLSNNSISSFDGFSTALQAILDAPDTLEWIDLSFNDLPKISEALLEYKNLKVLYLHANVIESIQQVDKLAALPNLKTLTLHGNFVDGAKGYRQYVITTIPQLQYLDFSRITKADRDKAGAWKTLKIIGHQKKKKRAAIEE